MIKVLFESSIFLHQDVGGISKYITELNNQFKKKKVQSIIYSPLTINQYLDKKKDSNIFYIRFKKIPKFCRKFFFYLNNIFTLFYIKIYKPDIIHFSYYNNSLLSNNNTPYILTIYDLIHEKLNLKQKQFQKEKLINKARHIICISDQTKKDLIKYYRTDKKKISVIHLGINSKNKNKKIKKKKFILYVGNRDRYKNFLNFAKAYSRSKFLTKNFKIVCFGGGNFNKEEIDIFKKIGILKKIIHKNGNDKFLEKNYREASLFVSLSLLEGFGLTLLEAIKSECPVVCSDIKIFRETFGNSCFFVNPKDSENIQKGIEKILKSRPLQKKLNKKGKNILTKFTWEKCAEKTYKIYNKILIK